jgi:hypothetical protein
VVPERLLARRAGFLLDLIAGMAAGVVAARWSAGALEELAGGAGPDGRELPAKGWMAVRRLDWGSVAPAGVVVLERVRRAADEEAARALRLAVYRSGVLAAITATWPQDPGRRTGQEWKNLRAALPDGVGNAKIRNRTRQIAGYLRVHGVLPADLTELEDPARVAGQALLAADGKQLVTLDRSGDTTAVLRVQLPATAAPASCRDWAWHLIAFTLPSAGSADARLCTPTVRVVKHRVRVDLPFTTLIPDAPATGHRAGLGLDWGVSTLLTASIGRLHDGKVHSDGRMLRYDATGVSAKLHRLRSHREHLAAKRTHYGNSWPAFAPATRLAGGPVGGRPGRRPGRDRHLPGGPGDPGSSWPASRQRSPVRAGARDRDGRHRSSGRQGRDRGRRGPGPRHLQILPSLPKRDRPAAPRSCS